MRIRLSRNRSSWLHLAALLPGILALGITASGCGGSDPELSSAQAALIDAQCEFFDVNGHVQICHHTGSVNHPFTIIRTSVQGCIHGHAGHTQDYVAVGDPTCQGGGCLPATAPCDATLPCCDGSTCESGTCQLTAATCDPNPCDHGVCDDSGGTAICFCEEGWTGEHCDVPL